MKIPILLIASIPALAISLCFPAHAQSFDDGMFSFEIINPVERTCRVTGVVQSDDPDKPIIIADDEGTVDIPGKAFLNFDDFRVTEIAGGAFASQDFEKIHVPESVVRIGDFAFCEGDSRKTYDVELEASPDAIELSAHSLHSAIALHMDRDISVSPDTEHVVSPELVFVGKDVTDINGRILTNTQRLIFSQGAAASFSEMPDCTSCMTLYFPFDTPPDVIDPYVNQGFSINTYNEADMLVENVVIEPAEVEITCGESLQLGVYAFPNAYNTPAVIWTSSDLSVLSITQTGEITARANITADITVTAYALNGVKGHASVHTKGIFSMPKEYNLFLGDKAPELSSLIAGNQGFDPAGILWTSDNPEVVSIDQEGRMLAVSTGRTFVSAHFRDFTEVMEVTVWERPYDMTLAKQSLDATCPMWDQYSFNTTVPITLQPSGYFTWKKDITVSSDNPDVAEGSIYISEYQPDPVLDIWYKSDGDATLTVEISEPDGRVVKKELFIHVDVIPFFESLEFAPKGNFYIDGIGKSFQMEATATPDECNAFLDWRVKEIRPGAALKKQNDVASIDDTGLVTSISYGTTHAGVIYYPKEYLGTLVYNYSLLHVVKAPHQIKPDIEKIKVKKGHTFTILIKNWLKRDTPDTEEDARQEICMDFYVSVDNGDTASAFVSDEESPSVIPDEFNGEKLQTGSYLTVTGNEEGTANVTLTSPTGATATIAIEVESTTGTDTLTADTLPLKVLGADGTLIHTAATPEDIRSLPAGRVYILIRGNESRKLIR